MPPIADALPARAAPTARAAVPAFHPSARARTDALGWALVAPAGALLLLFAHLPVLLTIVDSFLSTPRPKRPSAFVGLANYAGMVQDPVFWKALDNNLVYAAVSVPVSVALALAMALLVNASVPGRALLRMAYFTPTVLPLIAVADIWIFFFTPDYGLVAALTRPFGLAAVNWLGSPGTALFCVTLVAIWKESGFFMIFYLAALQNLPPDLREAASIEGASSFQFLRMVTLPLLAPTTLFVVVNALVNAFRVVDQVFTMTGGGPDHPTSMLLFHLYETGFKFFDRGQAAAMTVALLVLLTLLAAAQFALAHRRVHYG